LRNIKPSSKFHHKVAIIGDGVAAGFGDYVTCLATPGLARHISAIPSNEPAIRQSWTMLNCGVFGTTSEDWHPECKESPSALRMYGRGLGMLHSVVAARPEPLWKRVFTDPRYKDAEIVIVCVGLNDSKFSSKPKDTKYTQENVMAICKELAAQGKEVLVCTLPLRWRLHLEKKADLFEKDKERNELLKSAVYKLDSKMVHIGADIGAGSFSNYPLYCADALHFSSNGYRRFAHELRETLVHAMVRIEARTWKKLI